jgi:hypothetical protein
MNRDLLTNIFIGVVYVAILIVMYLDLFIWRPN